MTIAAPMPTARLGARTDGSMMPVPKPCTDCKTRECEKLANDQLAHCAYGFNFMKLNDHLIAFGFIVDTYSPHTEARGKVFKKYKDSVIKKSHIANLVESVKNAKEVSLSEEAIKADKAITTFLNSESFQDQFIERLRGDIQKGLSFVHDYKQINSAIAQNINVIIEQKYSGVSLDEKLGKATHEEVAIYWASKFLQEKLNVAKFLIHPEWIRKESEMDSFRFHGLFNKYFRIYEHRFIERSIKTRQIGESRQNIYGNADALGVITHSFLDNALKYSHDNGKVEIFFSDEQDHIYFAVSSYGPRIHADEYEKIFHPFSRGKEAEKVQPEGAGYGLYLAQLIAQSYSTKISMQQDLGRIENHRFWTTFSVRIPASTGYTSHGGNNKFRKRG